MPRFGWRAESYFAAPCTAASLRWITELFSETEIWNTKTMYFQHNPIVQNLALRTRGLAFEEEREWRLILSEPPSPMPAKRFRVGKSTLVPYVEAEPLIKEGYFIKEVIVGPTPHPELSRDSVTALFQSLDHPGVTVRTSNVPYRHW